MNIKIYNEVLIDMNPESSSYRETIYEDSFEHKGSIAMMADFEPDEYREIIYYDDGGNEYKAYYWINKFTDEAYYVTYTRNGETLYIDDNQGLDPNIPASEINAILQEATQGGYTVEGGWGEDSDIESQVHTTMEGAYTASKDWDDEDFTPTFQQLYEAQGVSETFGYDDKEFDLTKSWAMSEFGLTEEQYETVPSLTMKPLEEINQQFQTDVGTFSDVLRETNVSLTEEIGSIQSKGGFAGESGALTQPLEYEKDLAASTATTAYGALSKSRVSDIKSKTTTMYDQYLANLVTAGE